MKKIPIRISAFFMLALLAVGVSPTALTLASAESAYTSVMQDLEKGGVSEAEYPVNNKDYSLKLIQIAEGVNGELFAYVYRPCIERNDIIATTIRISTNVEKPSYKDYALTRLSKQTVFDKYKVEGVTVSDAAERYYDIPTFHRKFMAEIDPPTTSATVNGQIVNEVAFTVGNLYIARTDEGGSVTYECKTTETILVTDKYCGYIRYTNGFSLLNSSCDAWYVAFSTDRKMEYLLEADVQYIRQDFWGDWEWRGGALWGSEDATNDATTGYSYIKCTDKAGNSPTWLLGNKYTWNRIETAAKFCENESENLSESVKTEIKKKEWVLRFKETDYKKVNIDLFGNHYQEWRTKVSEVTILRLKFETDGKVYNLGVVDNKQSKPPYSPPDNENTGFDFFAWLENVTGVSRGWWIAIAVIIVLAILMPILAAIFPVVGVVLKWLVKGIGYLFYYLFKDLWWLISAPFRLIAYIVKKRKGKKESGE